jgi:glycosyltransferase involved in cell wall biosynthesis
MRANVLFVAKFGTGTGYAWDTIERVLAGVARRLLERGIGVHVSYASLAGGEPEAMRGLGVRLHEVEFHRLGRDPRALIRFLTLLRRNRIRVLYLTDRPTWSPLYVLFRAAGVRRILVHDRTSGERRRRFAPVQLAKQLLHRMPWIAGDIFIGVSEYVTRRLQEVNGTPASRTVCVHNGIDLTRFHDLDPGYLRRQLRLAADAPVVFFAGRAEHYKGIGVLLDAVKRLQDEGRSVETVCCGDGPELDHFREHAANLSLKDVHFLGRRSDVAQLLAGATVAVVPSLWAEAFGLTVVEAMAAGVPVVATSTGGIPELVENGVTGVLVPAGDADALAAAIGGLLQDAGLCARMGSAGRERAQRCFEMDRTIAELYQVLDEVIDPAWTASDSPA